MKREGLLFLILVGDLVAPALAPLFVANGIAAGRDDSLTVGLIKVPVVRIPHPRVLLRRATVVATSVLRVTRVTAVHWRTWHRPRLHLGRITSTVLRSLRTHLGRVTTTILRSLWMAHLRRRITSAAAIIATSVGLVGDSTGGEGHGSECQNQYCKELFHDFRMG